VAALASEGHDRDHVLGRLGKGDRRGPLVDGEVPCLPCVVPVVVTRDDDLAEQAGSEDTNVFGHCGHRYSSVVRLRVHEVPPPEARSARTTVTELLAVSTGKRLVRPGGRRQAADPRL